MTGIEPGLAAQHLPPQPNGTRHILQIFQTIIHSFCYILIIYYNLVFLSVIKLYFALAKCKKKSTAILPIKLQLKSKSCLPFLYV